jgi:hypothetical protein
MRQTAGSEHSGIRETARSGVRKALLLALALIGAWILFKVVIGVVTALAWTVVVILAIVAIVYVLFFW